MPRVHTSVNLIALAAWQHVRERPQWSHTPGGGIGGRARLLDCRGGPHVLVTRSQNKVAGTQGARPISETVLDSPSDLVADNGAEVWARLARTAEITECVRVSAGRWC